MRKSYRIMAAIAVTLLLGSCATNKPSVLQTASNFINKQSVTVTTKDTYPSKNPSHVTLFIEDQTPYSAYRVIGVATVSKFNLIGVERKSNTINSIMKNLAASIGGDGLIDIKDGKDHIQASIIQ